LRTGRDAATTFTGLASRGPAAGGGPRYLPARVVGLIPRHLDATGILLNNPGYS